MPITCQPRLSVLSDVHDPTPSSISDVWHQNESVGDRSACAHLIRAAASSPIGREKSGHFGQVPVHSSSVKGQRSIRSMRHANTMHRATELCSHRRASIYVPETSEKQTPGPTRMLSTARSSICCCTSKFFSSCCVRADRQKVLSDSVALPARDP